MDAHSLMRKLIEIERALPTRDDCAIRNLILAAQDGVLQLERENEELALQNAGLRLRLQTVHNSALPLVARPLNTAVENPDATSGQSADESPCESSSAGLCADPTNADENLEANPGIWRTTHFFFS